MRAVIISGLWPTKDENGLFDLGHKIQNLGHHVDFYHYGDKAIPPADIMIGHSLGGERCVNIAQANEYHLTYLALIDPVAGAWFPFFFWVPSMHFELPHTVNLADCFKRKSGIIPPSSRILNPGQGYQFNWDIDSNHADAPRNPFVVETILNRIKSLV